MQISELIFLKANDNLQILNHIIIALVVCNLTLLNKNSERNLEDLVMLSYKLWDGSLEISLLKLSLIKRQKERPLQNFTWL